MKLFIDDIRNAPDDKWHVARTVTEAIRCIFYHQDIIEEISIDHDISHQVGMGALSRPYPCEETFAAVAYFIVAMYRMQVLTQQMEKTTGAKITCLSIDCPERTGGVCRGVFVPKIVIHSSNIVGAENMQHILQKADIPCRVEFRGAANRLEMEL